MPGIYTYDGALREAAIRTGVLDTFFGNLAYGYRDNGVPYGFLVTWMDKGIGKPDGYSEEKIKSIFKSGELGDDGIYTPGEDDDTDVANKPNIIFLQLESFIDPTQVEGLEFSKDPTPNYRQLMKEYSSGYLTVPAVGAGTANVEFEVMTGMSVKFFGPGEYPYKEILRTTTCESTPYDLKQLGYSSHAIHNHRGAFYGRNKVFSNMGFDTFTSLEYNEGLPHESVALEGVTFSAQDGQLVGIIGHTGSGKSTLVQHLNGLLKPKSGSIVVGGTDITSDGVVMRDIRKKIGLVFQYPEYQLFEETVAKDVAFGPANLGLSEAEIDECVKEAIEMVGLDYEKVKNVSPFELSGGQKRRAAIAGVIAMKPEVLILDEPTAGLNPKAHADILNMVETIHRKSKNIIFLVSHNMNDIARMSDKVLVMNHGRLVMDGTPAEVFSREEELKSMGLALPDSMEIMMRLKKAGMDINTDCLTMDEAAEEIAKVLAK